MVAIEGRLVAGLVDASGRQRPPGGAEKEAELEAIAELTLQRCSKNSRDLRNLDLAGTVFTSLFWSELSLALSHNTKIQELYLDYCQLGDEGARVLSQGLISEDAQTLRLISLEGNEIHCKGAAAMARVFNASRRSKWGRTFGGYRAPNFGPGHGVQHCSLRRNRIGQAGARSMAEALTGGESLETLDLEANQIDDWAVGWLAQVLRNNNILRDLNLRNNPIGDDGIGELRSACKSAKATLVIVRLPAADATPDLTDIKEATLEPGLRADYQRRREKNEGGDEEDFADVLAGQRSVTVYVTEAPEDCSTSVSTAFFRPGSAMRHGTFTARVNCALGVEEPAAVMADSRPELSEARGCSRQGRPSSASSAPKRPASARASALRCTYAAAPVGAEVYCIAPGPRKAPPRVFATYSAGGQISDPQFQASGSGGAVSSGNCAARESASRLASVAGVDFDDLSIGGTGVRMVRCLARARASAAEKSLQRAFPGERAVGADDKETNTAFSSPSRWRRKPRESGHACGGSICGAASRRPHRPCSMPSLRRAGRYGMLLGPRAAEVFCS